MTIRETVLQRLALAERDEESSVLGVTVHLRELTRAAFKEAARWAASSDLADRERARGALFVSAVQEALDAEDWRGAIRMALTAYYIGTPERATDLDRWNAGLLAAGWIDPETGASVVSREEILNWPARDELREEVQRLVNSLMELSEVGSEALKSGGSTAPAE